MADERIALSEQIPEADLLEQQAPLDAPLTAPDDLEPLADAPVDEADQWEQHQPAPIAEDDYPHDRFETGRS